MLGRLLALATLLLAGSALAAPAREPPFSTFANVTVFKPPSYYPIPRTLYARTVLLDRDPLSDWKAPNVLLATWENYSPEPVYFPIFRSADGGETWTNYSSVRDQVNGWGLRYQPFLYELGVGEQVGKYGPGTVLLAGNSIPADLSRTKIDVYASRDKGLTWTFVSSVAQGGEAEPDNGLTPVWEPFLMYYEGQIVCYYSDQRDPKHGQKLVHQTSRDLVNWGPVVNDVAYDTYDWRPGMTTVTRLPTGAYMMTYEFYGAVEADFAVYYRTNANPLDFNSSPGQVIRAKNTGTVPVSSPYITWTPVGGALGTVAVSCGTLSTLFVNQAGGRNDSWVEIPTPEGVSYTRHLRVMPNPADLMLIGGGVLNGANNSVTASVMNLQSAEGWGSWHREL